MTSRDEYAVRATRSWRRLIGSRWTHCRGGLHVDSSNGNGVTVTPVKRHCFAIVLSKCVVTFVARGLWYCLGLQVAIRGSVREGRRGCDVAFGVLLSTRVRDNPRR